MEEEDLLVDVETVEEKFEAGGVFAQEFALEDSAAASDESDNVVVKEEAKQEEDGGDGDPLDLIGRNQRKRRRLCQEERTAAEATVPKIQKRRKRRKEEEQALCKKWGDHVKLSRELRNRCRFRCPTCKQVFNAWSKLSSHWGGKAAECVRCRVNQPGVAEEVYLHRCSICLEEVLSDLYLFSIHLTQKHDGMAMSKYREASSPSSGENTAAKKRTVCRTLLSKEDIEELKRNTPTVPPMEKKVMPQGSLPDVDMAVGKVENICEFACTKKECGYTSGSWLYFSRHVYRCLGNRTRTFHPEYLSEARYHRCHLCSCCVLCDKHVVTAHLIKDHNLHSRQKYLQMIEDSALERKLRTETGIELKKCSVTLLKMSRACLTKLKVRRETVHKFLDLSRAEESLEIRELCVFRCRECGQDFGNYQTFFTHKHEGQVGKKRKVPSLGPDMLSKAVSYECRLCRRLVLCDYVLVRQHVKAAHGMRLAEYMLAAGHRGGPVGPAREEEERLAGARKEVPTVPPPKSFYQPPETVPRERATLRVEHLCLWACPKCGLETNSWSPMALHAAACVEGRKGKDERR